VVTCVIFVGVTLTPVTGCPAGKFAAIINPAINARTTITSTAIARLLGSFDAGADGGAGGGESVISGTGSSTVARGESDGCIQAILQQELLQPEILAGLLVPA